MSHSLLPPAPLLKGKGIEPDSFYEQGDLIIFTDSPKFIEE